jgi:hypothetical protein
VKFTLSIEANNAAFHGEGCQDSEHACPEQEAEIARILKKIAYEAEGGLRYYADRTGGRLSAYIDDVNGNQVGEWTLEDSE